MALRKGQRETSQATAPRVAGDLSLRIILVGRTGLESRLRVEPGTEIIRVRSPLEAIGELSESIHHDGELSNVIIVPPAGDPAQDGQAGEFIGALRRLDPEVRVLRLTDGKRQMPLSGDAAYDGAIGSDADINDIRAALNPRVATAIPLAVEESDDVQIAGAESGDNGVNGEVPSPRSRASNLDGDVSNVSSVSGVSSAPVPEIVTFAAASADAEPSTPLHSAHRRTPPSFAETTAQTSISSDLGDETIVRLLLQGHDITDAALAAIRRRLSGRDVSFLAGPRAASGGGDAGRTNADGSANEAVVAWRGRILGRLRSETVRSEELVQPASWLAAWLVLRDQHAQLREAAFADPLTGAHNRRYFDQFLGMAMEEARKERRGVTLLMFDIDNFKQFNESHGHSAGDDILRETVRLLRSVIRPTDKVCRIGGDEFAVIFYEPTGPRTPSSRPPNDVHQIAHRFQREIAEQKFPKLGRDAPGTLTISGGLATYPWDGMTAEALLARADELAMQSKRSGKNCITFGPEAGESIDPGEL